jgi:hypothetical protein
MRFYAPPLSSSKSTLVGRSWSVSQKQSLQVTPQLTRELGRRR